MQVVAGFAALALVLVLVLVLVQDVSYWLLSRNYAESISGIGSAVGMIAIGYHGLMKNLPVLRGPGSSGLMAKPRS